MLFSFLRTHSTETWSRFRNHTDIYALTLGIQSLFFTIITACDHSAKWTTCRNSGKVENAEQEKVASSHQHLTLELHQPQIPKKSNITAVYTTWNRKPSKPILYPESMSDAYWDKKAVPHQQSSIPNKDKVRQGRQNHAIHTDFREGATETQLTKW